ncbi:MAG: YezD family protein [Candidatus Omnitrophica bacterium]|nr:YezD family protein [Candidatus Omnitrophota bacterium]
MDKEQERIGEIIRFISQLNYGEVIITVHDSEIVQVEKREKKRFKPQKRLPAQS